jgi:glycosyltransferase involved in cell wall biosynthesis
MSLRVLFFAYYFPPSAGPGVRRSVRFVKELPALGVEPIVVTVEGDTFRNREEFGIDETAQAEIPPDVRVERVPSWSMPGFRRLLMRTKLMRAAMMTFYPMFWERQALWVIPAIRRGLQLVREVAPDVIYTTTGPFCSNVIGLTLRRMTGVPWVTDYRDLWTGSWVKWWPTRVHFELERALERASLATADAVIANTPHARRVLLEDFPRTAPDKVAVITNGWDAVPPRRACDVAARSDDRIVILHTGSFMARAGEAEGDSTRGSLKNLVTKHVEYRLTEYDISTHGPRCIFQALRSLLDAHPRLARKLLLKQVGSVHDSWRREATALGIDDLVEFTGPRSFLESRAMQQDADVLLLTTVSRYDGGPVPIVNAKLYEYLYAGKPVLLLSDPGDGCDFAADAGVGTVVPPRDVPGLTGVLKRLAEGRGLGAGGVRTRDDAVSRFSSVSLGRDLADVLTGAASVRGDRRDDGADMATRREPKEA